MSALSATTRRIAPAGPAVRRALFVLIFLLASLVSPRAAGQDPVRVLAPTFGRPVFVAPGTQFGVATTGTAPGSTRAGLILPGDPPGRIPLDVLAGTFTTLRVSVPADTPVGTYDLEIAAGATTTRVPHAVAVTRATNDVRLVHLADLPRDPHNGLDPTLVRELNLLAPTAIVLTGNLLPRGQQSDADWARLVRDLSELDAPLIIAAGPDDDIEAYSRFIGPSPIGVVDVGRHRCLVLLDHPAAPVTGDDAQLDWLTRELDRPTPAGVTILAGFDGSLDLLSAWQAAGQLEQRIRQGRIGIWLTGADAPHASSLLAAARPLAHLPPVGRTGIRVIDLSPARGTTLGAGGAFRLGGLLIRTDGPSDGTRTRLAFEIENRHQERLPGLELTVRLADTRQAPWCRGGRIVEQYEHAGTLVCRVRIDAPPGGVVAGAIGTGARPAAAATASLATGFHGR